MRRLLVVVLAACPRAAAPVVVEPPLAVPAEGISIAMYVASGPPIPGSVVDDRRWLEVTNGTIVLDRIDPAASLPALFVEALDRQPFSLGACTRELIPGSPVRCHVTSAPGRRFVRVLHVAPSITYRLHHAVMVTDNEGDDDQAIVTTRFAITTPAWTGQRAEVVLHDGPPGGDRPSHAITHGKLVLDGGVAMLVNSERTLRAHVRNVYDGAIRDAAIPATDPAWGRESKRSVSTVLDVEALHLPVGPFDVRIASKAGTRDVVVAATAAEKLGTGLRLPLGIDDTLDGMRRNFSESHQTPTGRRIVQRLQLSVTNASDMSRDVWVEERLRPARKRDIQGVHPPLIVADRIARMHVVVPPRGMQHISLTITYDM